MLIGNVNRNRTGKRTAAAEKRNMVAERAARLTTAKVLHCRWTLWN